MCVTLIKIYETSTYEIILSIRSRDAAFSVYIRAAIHTKFQLYVLNRRIRRK